MAKKIFKGSFEWLSALPLLLVTGALAIIALSALTSAQSPEVKSREHLFSYFQRLTPASYDAAEDFQVILIDRESIDQVGPWPWPRTVLADLVKAAHSAGAKAVILTEAVDAPDPLSPEIIGEFWLSGASDEILAQQLARLPQTDVVLAEAFSQIEGAVGVALTPPEPSGRNATFQRTEAKTSEWLTYEGTGEYLSLPAARYFYSLNPALAENAKPAIAALVPDTDGVIRRLPVLWSLKGMPAPAIALEAARMANDGDTVNVFATHSSANTQGRLLGGISIDAHEIALSPDGAMRIHLPKRLTVPSTSAARLLRSGDTNSQLNDAVVLIGLDTDLGDAVTTARGSMAPAALHALIGAQINAGKAPNRPNWTGYLEAIAVMLFGAAAIMTAQRLQFWHAVGFAALASIVLMLGAFAMFAFGNLLLNPLAPSLALFVSALSVAGGKSLGGVLLDDSVRGSFHDTLPEPTMKRLREEGGTDILEGAHRQITVLSCELRVWDDDLRKMENLPDDVTKLIAAASLDLRQTIIASGGTADQAEGGRLFAYYNAPTEMADHIQAGAAAALRLVESMDKINDNLDSSSRTRGMQINLAIGVATGECFVGPMGHGRNNRYSAIGPAVDRALLLRNQSEKYGPAMICDEAVYRHTHHHFAFLELDKLKVSHIDRPFSIYALIGNPFIKSSKGFRALDDAHRQMLTAYRVGNVEVAKEMLGKAKLSPGANIALFDIYQERLSALEKNGVPTNWDGVHQAEI